MLGIPEGALSSRGRMTDKELSEALTNAARVLAGGCFNNDYHKRTEVKRFIAILESVTPLEFARMWQALLPDRDRPNWTEVGLWEAATGQTTLGM